MFVILSCTPALPAYSVCVCGLMEVCKLGLVTGLFIHISCSLLILPVSRLWSVFTVLAKRQHEYVCDVSYLCVKHDVACTFLIGLFILSFISLRSKQKTFNFIRHNIQCTVLDSCHDDIYIINHCI